MNFVSKLGFLKPKPKPKQMAQAMSENCLKKEERHIEIETDTNIFSIDLQSLKTNCQIFPGAPTKCHKCNGYFNVHSKIDQDKIWNCEFCGVQNFTKIDPFEIPKIEEVNYLIKSAEMLKNENSNLGGGLIFCIDMSGSMSFSTKISGNKGFKSSLTKEEIDMIKGFLEPGVTLEMYMAELMQQEGNVSFVTRKQCVNAAIENQIQGFLKSEKNKKVGLVVFNSEVNVLGDGFSDPLTIGGDRLYQEEEIISLMKERNHLLSQPIEKSSENLLAKLENLKEDGKTSLGPALLASLELAISQGKGTSILICSDGLANVGLGSLDVIGGFLTQSTQFYERIAKRAQENGITINLLTIRGEACKTDAFNNLIDLTNGKIARVDPERIAEDFANILKDEVIATDVEVSLKISEYLKFRNEDPISLQQNGSMCVKKLGNVMIGTKISFEYELKSEEELQGMKIVPEEIKLTFFQANILFKDMKGNLMLKSISKFQETTCDLKAAQQNADLRLLNNHCARKTKSELKSQNLFSANEYNANWRSYMEEVAEQNNVLEQQKACNVKQKKFSKLGQNKRKKAKESKASEKKEKNLANVMEEEEEKNNNSLNSINLSDDEDLRNLSEDELNAEILKGRNEDLF